jgi:hypothetical protein
MMANAFDGPPRNRIALWLSSSSIEIDAALHIEDFAFIKALDKR